MKWYVPGTWGLKKAVLPTLFLRCSLIIWGIFVGFFG